MFHGRSYQHGKILLRDDVRRGSKFSFPCHTLRSLSSLLMAVIRQEYSKVHQDVSGWEGNGEPGEHALTCRILAVRTRRGVDEWSRM